MDRARGERRNRECHPCSASVNLFRFRDGDQKQYKFLPSPHAQLENFVRGYMRTELSLNSGLNPGICLRLCDRVLWTIR